MKNFDIRIEIRRLEPEHCRPYFQGRLRINDIPWNKEEDHELEYVWKLLVKDVRGYIRRRSE